MDEKDLEILSDLVKTCNISKTAQRLFTTQSTVTKRLQKIEEELGIRLFLRSKKGLLPAPPLEGMMPEVESLMESMERIRSFADSFKGEISGTLRMGVSVNYARYRLPEVLKEYMEKYPKVDIHIHANRSINVYRDLTGGEISMAVIRGEYAWRGGDMILSRDRHCLIKNRAHRDVPLNELTFLARESDAGYLSELSRWMNEKGIRPSRSELVINDVETIVTMVMKGVGWSVVPEICLGRFDGIVEPVAFRDGNGFGRQTHILYSHNYLALPQARAFVEVAEQYETKMTDLESIDKNI